MPQNPPPEPPKPTLVSLAPAGPDEKPRASSTWGHWKLLAYATLGAAFGFLTGTGLYSEIRDSNFADLLLTAAVLALAAYVLFDPAMEFLHDRLGAKRSEFPEGRKVIATVVVAVATFAISAFHHSLGASLGKELGVVDGLGLAALVLIFVGVPAGAVTHWWARGAQGDQPRAKVYGAIAGLIAGVAGFFLVRRVLIAWIEAEDPSAGWPTLAAILLAALGFLGPGLLGGWALDKRRGRPDPTRGIFMALGALCVGSLILALILTHNLARAMALYPESAKTEIRLLQTRMHILWLFAAALICQNLGWALGLFLHHKSCDSHLAPSGPVTGDAAAGPKLVPFPGPRDAGSLVPVSSPDDNQTAAARAQGLLLKPKGDRLWASMALVLALVTSGLAYRVGTLRKDPEIATSVEGNLQQDSGLRRAGLTVHSTGRVVTIAGVVDDESEHAAALQRALSVRGVKQLIDQIQVAPVTPPSTTPASTTAVVPPSQTPAPAINATISIGGSTGPGKVNSAATPKVPGSQKPVATAKAEVSQKAVETPKTAEAPKHKGLLNFLKKDKNNQASATDAKKTADTPKTPDAEKHKGLFHFLKKDKDKNNNGNNNVTPVPNNKNDKSNKNPKKEVTKNPAVH